MKSRRERQGKKTNGELLVTLALVLLVLLTALSPPLVSDAHAGIEEEALRQLDLAEEDLAAANYERAAASAASALRLDPGLLAALVTRALALKGMGQLEDARALLRAYTDLRGTLPVDDRVAPALAELDRMLAANAVEPAEDPGLPPPVERAGPVALLHTPDRPGAAEDAWAAAAPFLADTPPVAVLPLRTVLPAPGDSLLVFGASSTACPASLPAGGIEEQLLAAEAAAADFDAAAADIAIATAELHSACGDEPAGPEVIARLVAAQAASHWFTGEPELAARLWTTAFRLDPTRPVESSLAPTATAMQLGAKQRAGSEPVRGRVDFELEEGWSAWVDGRAVDNEGVLVPRGRRIVRVVGPEGESKGVIVAVADASVLVTTAVALTTAVGAEPVPPPVLSWLAALVEEAAQREGAVAAIVVNLNADPAVVRRVQDRHWLVLTADATRRSGPGRRVAAGAGAGAERKGPPPGSVALLGGGLAATVAGVIVAGLAHRDGVVLAEGMGTPRGYGDNYQAYEALRTQEGVGAGLAIGGGVVAGIGVVTFVLPSKAGTKKVDGEASP